MKTYPGINYTFRPASYWAETCVRPTVLRNVKSLLPESQANPLAVAIRAWLLNIAS